MTGNPILYGIDGGIAHITLNRPEASNALDLQTATQLRAAVDRAGADGARAVLLTANGTRFCAGGDLASMVAVPAGERPKYLHDLASTVEGALGALRDLPVPVVGAVQGAAAGAGLAVVLSCDVVVAAESAQFVMAYAGVGLTPDCGVSYLLPRAIGQQRALDLALTGRRLRASEAQEWGLVTRSVADEVLIESATELVQRIAQQATEALGQAKRLLRASWESDQRASAADEVETISRAVQTAEATTLIARFMNGS